MALSAWPLESKHAVIDGVRLHYVEYGSGPPALFLHGNPTWSYLWRNVLPEAGRTHRAIALDLAGFGLSEHPVGFHYSFDEHAAMLAGFIDHLELDDLSLLLHDWGGILGMHWAVQHLDRVSRVALLSTFVAPVDGRFRSALMRLPRIPGLGALLVQRLNLFVPLALRAGIVHRSRLTPQLRGAYARPFPDAASRLPIRRWTEQLPASSQDRTYRVLQTIAESLPSFNRPVLILKGRYDPILTTSRARWLQEALPQARLEVLPGAGHFLQEDQPERVASLLVDFLTQGSTDFQTR
jgi:haloalkane dehalogenase